MARYGRVRGDRPRGRVTEAEFWNEPSHPVGYEDDYRHLPGYAREYRRAAGPRRGRRRPVRGTGAPYGRAYRTAPRRRVRRRTAYGVGERHGYGGMYRPGWGRSGPRPGRYRG